jgi:iron complex outermembrane receptor protein
MSAICPSEHSAEHPVHIRQCAEGHGITRMDKALDLVSGVSHMNNYGGLWDAYSFRGFAGDANNVPSGFLVNGFAARGFAGPRDTSSIERMDVLKGPTSALFGVANLAVQ